MKLNSFLNRRWRSLTVLALFIVLSVFAADYATSHSGGQTGSTLRPGDSPGCTCHCANSNSNTTVTISTSATSFEVNTTYTFTVTVSNSGESKAGVDVAVFNGSLSAGSDGLQKVGSQLTQNGPKTLPATWTFTYTTPSTSGYDTIYAVGNAVNNDGGNGTGNCSDNWNHAANFVMNVTSPSRLIAVGRNTINFGNRRVGGNYTDTTKVSASGDQALSISSSGMKTATQFTSTPTASRSLNSGSSETQTITFAPTAKGIINDSLIINSNSTVAIDQRKAIYVTGTAVQAAFNGQNSIPFGSIRVGTNKQITYNFTNSGDDTLFLSNPVLTGGAGVFTLVSGPTPSTLKPGEQGAIVVKFAPTSKQVYTATLALTAANGVTVPVINLVGTGSAPILTVAAQTDIGLARVGLTRNGGVSITNGGDDDLHITAVTISPLFSGAKFITTGGQSYTIPVGGGATIPITYTPTTERTDTAQITVTSDDIAQPTKQFLVVASAGVPRMTLASFDTIKFGDVRVGSSAQSFALQVKNTGTFDLTVLGISPSPSAFTLVSKPSIVSPKASAQAILKFTPAAAGPITGMAIISGDDGTNQSDTIYLLGNGTTSSFDVPDGISFGDVKVGSTRDSTLVLKNLGTAALKIVKYSLANPNNGFILTDTLAHNIPAKDSIKIKVRFNAFQEISYAGVITLLTDESSGNTRTIALTGRGVNSKLNLDQASLEFGNIDLGKSSSKMLVITNTGTAPSTINALAITGSNAFVIDSPTAPMTIPANGSKTIYLTYHSTTLGNVSGSLAITAAEGSPLQVSLHGFGVDTVHTSVRIISDAIESFSINPNPAHDQATLQISLKRDASDLKIQFYDAAAHLISTQEVGDVTVGQQRLALQLPKTSGVVFIRISSGSTPIGTAQIVITR